MRSLIVTWLALFNAIDSHFEASVRPRIVSVGQDVAVTCRVPRDATNRALTIGLENWTASTYALDGDRAPITHQRIFRGVVCDAGSAFCAVTRAGRSDAVARAPLEVICHR